MRAPTRFAAFLLAATLFSTPLAAQTQPGVPSPEAAQARGTAPTPTVADVSDLRTSQAIVFGDDPCPAPPTPEDIIICVRFEEGDRFRIPENLRTDPNAPENQSWTNKAIELSYVGRTGIGSCSPVGGGGFTGCNEQLINQAVAERRGRPEINWARLIEEARRERLAGIGAAAAQAEAEAGGNRRLQQLRLREGQTCPPSTELVLILCTLPDGSPAPAQEPGEPQFPVGTSPQRR